MKIEIKHWLTGSILFEGDFASVAAALTAAVTKGADLRSADLSGADLRSADLRSADLRSANLRSADLRSADLRSADLRSANLSGADLSGADLSGADLSGANLSGAKNAELAVAKTRILPQGALIGWKKLRSGVIAKLRIPEGAKRSHAFGRKCRAEFAEVLELIPSMAGIEPPTVAYSMHDEFFEYRAGQIVKPKNGFSQDWQEECAAGIHFFITREEAVGYDL